MEEFVYYNDLLIIYGKLLTEKNYQIFEYYYGENLSMQEIADLMDVSKSFVGNSIKKTEKKLIELEEKMRLFEKKKKIMQLLEKDNFSEIKEYLRNNC